MEHYKAILLHFCIAIIAVILLCNYAPDFISRLDKKSFGVVATLVGIIFSIVDGFFKRAYYYDKKLIKEYALGQRDLIDIEKTAELRSQFIRVRWVIVLVSYLLIAVFGVLLIVFDGFYGSNIIVCFSIVWFFPTLAFLLQIVWADFDRTDYEAYIEFRLAERAIREKELQGLNPMGTQKTEEPPTVRTV